MNDGVVLFACIEKNIGDDLFIKILADRYSNTKFIISDLADYGTLSSIKNLKFSTPLRQYLRLCDYESDSLIKRVIASALKKVVRAKLGTYENAVYIVGNAFKNNNYIGDWQTQWFKDRLKVSRNFYLLSTNFGPYNKEGWKKDFDKIFPNVTDVCFREKKSYDLFSNLDNVRYAPDAVLSLGFQKRVINKDKYIIISLIDCGLSSRSQNIQMYRDDYENALSRIANRFIDDGVDVYILNSNELQDNNAAYRVLSKINNKERCKIVSYRGDLNAIFDLFSKASFVLGTRLHTVILGWLYKIPTIPVIYDIKIEGIISSCKYNGKTYTIENIAEISCNDVIESFRDYSFELDDEVVKNSNNQFIELDKVLMV